MRRPDMHVEKGEEFFENGFSIYVNKVYEHFFLPEHAHDFYEISYVWEGSGFHYIGEQTIRVSKGDLFFIPIGISHIFRPSSPNPNKPLRIGNCIFDASLFHFLTSILPEQYHMYRFNDLVSHGGQWLQMREQSREFEQVMSSLFIEFQQKRTGYETMMCGLLLQLLIVMERAIEHKEASSSPNQDRMEAVLRSIRSRLADKITLASLAKEVGIGTRQLQRIITEHTSESFSELLSQERINQSCRLLADSSNRDLSIADIAAAVGIQDPKRFYRLFKEKTGVTPATYRRRNHM
ncbi:AraC family transcriptional regulator [Paenibacillus qinlingensis]|uniref:AraC family transcriptional regulator n=1 Tax=Paenibacillus qinlingensis TaxID=1837343 RepID=UPI001565A18D|nr:helix-turn-helix transcriptional regulator [Paenibacillus qinlingensis]NQX59844.1 helix-turn-helix domain-containing protein [Paenibacillus qinlingensis]